jgi:hypothetical protein
MDAFFNDADLQAWKQAYRSLQAPRSDDCLSDEQLIALVLNQIQDTDRTRLADHIVRCQLCTDAYQLLLRLPRVSR